MKCTEKNKQLNKSFRQSIPLANSQKQKLNGHSRTVSNIDLPSSTKLSQDVSFTDNQRSQNYHNASANKLKMSLIDLEAKNAQLTANLLNQQDCQKKDIQTLQKEINEFENFHQNFRIKTENDKNDFEGLSFIINQDQEKNCELHRKQTQKSWSKVTLPNRSDEVSQLKIENNKLKDQVETTEAINKWLKNQLSKITNNEDWIIYKQLFITSLEDSSQNHKYYFKDPQKKEILLKHLKEKNMLQGMLEMAEYNEHNIEKALRIKISEFQMREQEYIEKIKQLESSLKQILNGINNYRKHSKKDESNLVSSQLQLTQAKNDYLNETIKSQLGEINNLKNEFNKKMGSLDYQLKKEKNQNYSLKEQLSNAEANLKNREAYWKEVEIAFQNYKSKFDQLSQENRLMKQQLEKNPSRKAEEENKINLLEEQIEKLKDHHLNQLKNFQKDKLAEEQILADRIYELENLFKQSEQKNNQFKQQIKEQSLENDDLRQKVKEQQKQIEQLTSEIQNLRKNFSGNQEGEASLKQLSYFEKRVQTSAQKINMLKKELSFEQKENQKKQQQILLNQFEIQINQFKSESDQIGQQVNSNLIEQLEFLQNQMGQIDAHFIF